MNRATMFLLWMLLVQFVSPNRIQLIQLIVQRVAAIFRQQDRVLIIHKCDIIERRMVGVAKDNERDESTVSRLRLRSTRKIPPQAPRAASTGSVPAILSVSPVTTKKKV